MPRWHTLSLLSLSLFLTQARILAGFLPQGPAWANKLQTMFAEAISQESNGGGAEEAAGACLAADELVRKRGADNYRQAVKLYKESLARDPDNESLRFKMAEASVFLMRTIGNANSVMIDGLNDTPANRAMWKEYAPAAYDILHEFHKANPGDAKLYSLMTEAYTYRTSAKGVVKAAIGGDAVTFIRMINRFADHHPDYDAGVPYIYRGAMLLASPWPIRDIKGAREAFGNALKIAPGSRRNNFFVGVSAYHAGDYSQALESFEKAMVSEPVASSEVDVADFFLSEARRSAEVTREKLKK